MKRSIKFLLAITILLVIIFAIYYTFFFNNSNSNSYSIGTNIGNLAPDIKLYLTNGQIINLSYFRGQNVLLWFVATWCSSCQIGAQMLSSNYYQILHNKGYIIIVVELYNDLGQPGHSIEAFAEQFGGGFKSGWFYATSTQEATLIYDPNGYLDIFYVINKNGIIIQKGYDLPASLPNLINSL
jgi:thiol-disulfide isomerase/thioredoxin